VIHWNPSPDIFSVGPLHVRWYSLMFLIGFSVAYQMFKWMCEREKKPTIYLDTLLIYSFVGCTVGARLGHCLFYEPDYYLASWSNALEILMIWKGGLASHGGGIGVMISLWLFSRNHREFSFMWLLDHAVIPVALTGGLIRIGNLMNSEIIGKPTAVAWAFIFERVDQVPRHPAQIYESLSYLIWFGIATTMYARRKDIPGGLIFGLSLIWIFMARILWEFFKEQQVAFESHMTFNMGQLLSFPFIIAGIYLVVRALRTPTTIVTE
jgi:phosphatidylglycerol:prolipoprotein diacylglycerol transferase